MQRRLTQPHILAGLCFYILVSLILVLIKYKSIHSGADVLTIVASAVLASVIFSTVLYFQSKNKSGVV